MRPRFQIGRGLIEIENTPTNAVYLTDREVPESIIESFVAAGHQVDVRPYSPQYESELFKSLANPVLQVEVKKFDPLFLVQGDSP